MLIILGGDRADAGKQSTDLRDAPAPPYSSDHRLNDASVAAHRDTLSIDAPGAGHRISAVK
jgi:hypothetical protein